MKLADLTNIYKNFNDEQLESMIVNLQEQINNVKIELISRHKK